MERKKRAGILFHLSCFASKKQVEKKKGVKHKGSFHLISSTHFFFYPPLRQRYHVATYWQAVPKLFSPGNISMQREGRVAKCDKTKHRRKNTATHTHTHTHTHKNTHLMRPLFHKTLHRKDYLIRLSGVCCEEPPRGRMKGPEEGSC